MTDQKNDERSVKTVMMFNITVIGAGYVGLSTAVFLAKRNHVTAVDINEDVVTMINNGKCHLNEGELIEAMQGKLHLRATTNIKEGCDRADIIFIAVPTNFEEEKGCFNMDILDNVLKEVIVCSNSTIVIKSTVPIGYTKSKVEEYDEPRILFSPEFMREGRSLYDVTFPSRVIIGREKGGEHNADFFAGFMYSMYDKNIGEDPPIVIMGTGEAEAVKLFANTYLAMRVAFFNELDMFAEKKDLDTAEIINGIGFDSRIGNGYNNPSFGFGGYCLPKDSRQLAGQMKCIEGHLIRSIPKANDERILDIAKKAAWKTDGVIGFYGIAMKAGSDNARASATVRVIEELQKAGREVVMYDDSGIHVEGIPSVNSLEELIEASDIILTNRKTEETEKIPKEMLYTRDVFGDN